MQKDSVIAPIIKNPRAYANKMASIIYHTCALFALQWLMLFYIFLNLFVSYKLYWSRFVKRCRTVESATHRNLSGKLDDHKCLADDCHHHKGQCNCVKVSTAEEATTGLV